MIYLRKGLTTVLGSCKANGKLEDFLLFTSST